MSERRRVSVVVAVTLLSIGTVVGVGIIGAVPAMALTHTNAGLLGWSGEQVVSHRYDDWEPAIAADPHAPYLYRLVTRFGDPACVRGCPDGAIVLQVSANDGATWGPSRYLCVCKGAPWQADPQIVVVPNTGVVDAAFLNGYNVWFTQSLDHGKTWSKARSTVGALTGTDKPVLTTNALGNDVYIDFNGPNGGDTYVTTSHDAGVSWRSVKVTHGRRYTYVFGGHVLADGTVVFSESSLHYRADRIHLGGVNNVIVVRSKDRGATWTHTRVATVQLGGYLCPSKGCTPDFYDGHVALAADGGGRLLVVADGALTPGGTRSVFAWLSTDSGATWGRRVQLSKTGVNGGFPAAVGTKDGQFRVWFADRRTGEWNTFYRTSSDGVHWSHVVRLSDATSGASYKSKAGYQEFYGDYGEIDVTDTGKTVAIWGEGPSYRGPGGSWFDRQL